jgi:hypothetical protein
MYVLNIHRIHIEFIYIHVVCTTVQSVRKSVTSITLRPSVRLCISLLCISLLFVEYVSVFNARICIHINIIIIIFCAFSYVYLSLCLNNPVAASTANLHIYPTHVNISHDRL